MIFSFFISNVAKIACEAINWNRYTEKGLLMKNYSDQSFRQTIHLPLDLYNDFSIETIVEFESGDNNSGHGLIWGFKDWDNYYSTVDRI